MDNVYFVNSRARKSEESLVAKLDKLWGALEVANVLRPGMKVLVKVHMGAPLCTRYLRPFFVRKIVDLVKKEGAKPIVTDTTGLGLMDHRGTASKYLEVAKTHGFTEETLGAPIIIGDGNYGDYTFKFKMGKSFEFKEVSLAGILGDADAVINLTHFKGHILMGIGGALKNLAIGFASKEGKYCFHYTSKPEVDITQCDQCGKCLTLCPVKAIENSIAGKPKIVSNLCIGCLACVHNCPRHAIKAIRRQDQKELQFRLADIASAVVGKIRRDRLFNFNFLLDIDWQCDCEHLQEGWSDLPIVPDIGILATKDPVAADQCSVDLVTKSPGIPGSRLEEVNALASGINKFDALFPKIPWKLALQCSEKLGVGSKSYKLVNLEDQF